MTTATMTTRTAVMNRAWELVKEHMRQNRYTVYVMARAMRDAWNEHRLRSEGIRPVCELTPLERDLVAARASADVNPTNETRLARAVEEEAVELVEKRELIEAAKGQICSVTFVKKDGSIRTMKVQPAKLRFHVKGDAASEQAQRAVATRAANHPNLLNVWDVEAQAPRSINLATVTRIAAGGLCHAYS